MYELIHTAINIGHPEMKKICSVTIVLFVLSIISEAQIQSPDVLWTQLHNISGTPYCWGGDIHQTVDGGFIIGGFTNPQGNTNFDVLLMKTDADGDTVWTRINGDEELREDFVCSQPT